SPSAAALVAAFVWFASAQQLAGLGGLAAAFLITAAAGALMVSRFRYYSFKEVNLGRRIPFTYLLGIVLIFILISLDPPTVLLAMFGSYAASGPLYRLWRRRRAASGTGTGNAG
ncbi:MAG: CDP-alcohol phosphatidyltransferase family protein, partial [Gammaproteobacteria bacterium]